MINNYIYVDQISFGKAIQLKIPQFYDELALILIYPLSPQLIPQEFRTI